MRWYRIFLVTVVYLLVKTISPSIATEPNQDKILPVSLISTINEPHKGRLLRENISANEGRYPIKGIDRGSNGDGADNWKYDDRVDKVNTSDSDVRAGGIVIRTEPETLKAIKPLSQAMPKVSESFAEKMSPILMKLKLQVWAKNGKSANFVQKELGLDELFGTAFTEAKNFKYYDDYVASQLPIWAKKGLIPNEVIAQLNLRGLPADVFKASPNFKYYDEFVSAQALKWSKRDLSVDEVLIKLGLNTIPETARAKAVNFKYYEEFLNSRMEAWAANNVPVSDVMPNLKLDKLTGKAFLSNSNYPYYKSYVKTKLKSWATNGVSPEKSTG